MVEGRSDRAARRVRPDKQLRARSLRPTTATAVPLPEDGEDLRKRGGFSDYPQFTTRSASGLSSENAGMTTSNSVSRVAIAYWPIIVPDGVGSGQPLT